MSKEIEHPVYKAKMLLETASTILKVIGTSYGESHVQKAAKQVEQALHSLDEIKTKSLKDFKQEMKKIEEEEIDWDHLPVDNSSRKLKVNKFVQSLLNKSSKLFDNSP